MNDLAAWIGEIFSNKDLVRMGHFQRVEDRNLGLGWIYYGLARLLRGQRQAVMIGSFRGFAPMMVARAFQDNGEDGRVTFIDPSLVDDFWKEPEAVSAHFASYGIDSITHHCVTTQDFRGSEADRAITTVDLLFVDGLHTHEQARFDYETFEDRLADDAITLFHDTGSRKLSRIYGAASAYNFSVIDYMADLRQRDDLDVLELPFGEGVTLVRKR
ncbi:MAG: class I SAM-dependent methyltransferase [Pseudomonadota bacterium]